MKSSWYKPSFDSDECLTNCWNDFDGIFESIRFVSFVCLEFVRLCMSSLLLWEFMSFMRFFMSLLLLSWLCWAFTSSSGADFWFELSICTWSMLNPFWLFLRDHVFCLSCADLLPLSLGTETSHFERSCACLFIWLLDLLDELLFHSSSFNLV